MRRLIGGRPQRPSSCRASPMTPTRLSRASQIMPHAVSSPHNVFHFADDSHPTTPCPFQNGHCQLVICGRSMPNSWAWFLQAICWLSRLSRALRPGQCRCRSTVIVGARPRSKGTPVRLTSTALNCVTGWTAVPSTPSCANRAFVGCAVSALHRPTGRAVIPSPSVTVAVVRWWVSIAVVRRPRVIILRLGRHECAKRDCANAASGQEYSRYTHRVASFFYSGRHCLSLSWPRQYEATYERRSAWLLLLHITVENSGLTL